MYPSATFAVSVAGQEANHLYGLVEHVQALVGGWPVLPHDVLVERFPRADPQEEPARHHPTGRRRGLGQ